jgi:hypothetical protein
LNGLRIKLQSFRQFTEQYKCYYILDDNADEDHKDEDDGKDDEDKSDVDNEDNATSSPTMLEECARANPDARIRPLTHVSVDRAFQAESVGSNSLVTILIAIRRSPNL